ncbi:glycosyltransferase family 4 protein [Lacibacter sp. H407]|uniref:glycosyltransferase family 4 protein n=1 Tax=Lacibacter sp. H407 TaxID=3133423 RepID=UPI0030C5284C
MRIIHFHNGAGGGVLSVIRNLLLYRQHNEIENHVIYTINKDLVKNFQLPGLVGAASEQVFYYSPRWNFYYTCRQLSKLLPDEQAVIVAHDWLELGMVSQLGLANPVIMFLHGDYEYYYRLAIKHVTSVNAFACVASAIKKKLQQQLPARTNDITYVELPVPGINAFASRKSGSRIVFIGRCEEGKGYFLLPLIDEQLRTKGHHFEWHIFGEGSDNCENQSVWGAQSNVTFYGVIPSAQMLNELPRFDFLVLPTIAEGMPVTIIEAMKAGVLAIVNNLPGGVQELIGRNERGVLIEGNKIDGYVKVFQKLQLHPEEVQALTTAAMQYANIIFDAARCTANIEQFLLQHSQKRSSIKKVKVYGSILDQPGIPNFIVYSTRMVLQLTKKLK